MEAKTTLIALLGLLDVLPYAFGLGFITILIVFGIFFFARRYSPAVEGQSHGNFEIVGADGDKNIRLKIKGALIETPRFLNDTNKNLTKMFIVDHNRQKLLNLQKDMHQNKEEIANQKDVLEHLEKMPSNEMMKWSRTYVVRDGFEKHVILQRKYIAESLDKYAFTETQNKFTLGFGFILQGQIPGWVKNETDFEGYVKDFGHYKLHYLTPILVPRPCPDCGGKKKITVDVINEAGQVTGHIDKDCERCKGLGTIEEKPVDVPSWFGQAMIGVPTTAELYNELKSKDAQIVNLKKQLGVTALDLSAAKTESDFDRESMEKLGVKDVEELGKKRKGLDLLDFALIGGPTIILFLVAQSLATNPLYGMVAGLFAGAGLVSLKKR